MAKLMVIALLCLLGASLSKAGGKEDMIKQFMEYADKCVGEVGAAPSDIDDMMKKQPSAGMPGKCLRACIFKKYEVMDDNGKFVKSIGLEHAKTITNNDPEKMRIVTEMANVCEAIAVPSDHCEAAEAYAKCFKEQAVAHGVDKIDF